MKFRNRRPLFYLPTILFVLFASLPFLCGRAMAQTPSPTPPQLAPPGPEFELTAREAQDAARKTEEALAQAKAGDCQTIIGQISRLQDAFFELAKSRGRIDQVLAELKMFRGFNKQSTSISPYDDATIDNLEQHNSEARRTVSNGIFKAQDAIQHLLQSLANCKKCPEERVEKRPGSGTEPPKNELTGMFNLINEDAQPTRFNTYGVTVDYTRLLNEAVKKPAVGLTVDFNADFRNRNGADLSKYSILGGATVFPFKGVKTTDRAAFFGQALFGVSHFKSDTGTAQSTANSFTMKLGGGLDVKMNDNFFIRPVEVDYAPTWFGTGRQDNIQFSFGAGVRWGKN